jgi:uncharacterized Zn-finger protein
MNVKITFHSENSFHFFPRIEKRVDDLLFSCDTCSILYDNADALVMHLECKHSVKARVSEEGETSTRDKKEAQNRGGCHQTSTRPRLYLCEFCGKSYTQSSHLWQHLRFHQGVKPFVCTYDNCDRRFTIRPDLNDHIRKMHTGERPFEW